MQTPAIKTVYKALKFKGYHIFDEDDINYNLNIIGIRNANRKSNSFDDLIFVMWKYKDRWRRKSYHVTTDPQLFFKGHPTCTVRKAYVKENQYLNSFKIGLQNGKISYKAFMNVYLLDLAYRFIPQKLKSGYSSIDFKCLNIPGNDEKFDKLPGSSLIFANWEDLKEFNTLLLKAKKNNGNIYSYTLLNSSDLLGFRNHY